MKRKELLTDFETGKGRYKHNVKMDWVKFGNKMGRIGDLEIKLINDIKKRIKKNIHGVWD